MKLSFLFLSQLVVFCCLLLRYGIQGLSCPSFDALIHALSDDNGPVSQCTHDDECTSMKCAIPGKATVGLEIKTCDTDPSVMISANIPSSGINNWSAIFKDQDEHIIPGYYLPGKRQGHLQVDLTTKPPSGNSPGKLFLGLTLKGCQQDRTAIPCVVKPILHGQEFSCGSKRTIRRSSCSILKLFECAENETCEQLGQNSTDGQCVCLKGFSRRPEGICQLDPTSVPISSTPSSTPPSHNSTYTDDPLPKDPATLAVNIVVPVLILTLVAVLVYAAFKHDLVSINRIRARLSRRRRRYEVAVQSDDEDDDAPLA